MRYTPRGTRTFRPGQTTSTFSGQNHYFEPPGRAPSSGPIVWSDHPPVHTVQILSDPPADATEVPGIVDPDPS